MKTIKIFLLSAMTSLTIIALLLPLFETNILNETSYVPQPHLSAPQMIWLARLMNCESGIKVSAINPNDLDNTPSYGILQFKPGTYRTFAVKYGLASTTDYMNPVEQIAIVEHWILEPEVDWTQQFPACVARLGLPPSSAR